MDKKTLKKKKAAKSGIVGKQDAERAKRRKMFAQTATSNPIQYKLASHGAGINVLGILLNYTEKNTGIVSKNGEPWTSYSVQICVLNPDIDNEEAFVEIPYKPEKKMMSFLKNNKIVDVASQPTPKSLKLPYGSIIKYELFLVSKQLPDIPAGTLVDVGKFSYGIDLQFRTWDGMTNGVENSYYFPHKQYDPYIKYRGGSPEIINTLNVDDVLKANKKFMPLPTREEVVTDRKKMPYPNMVAIPSPITYPYHKKKTIEPAAVAEFNVLKSKGGETNEQNQQTEIQDYEQFKPQAELTPDKMPNPFTTPLEVLLNNSAKTANQGCLINLCNPICVTDFEFTENLADYGDDSFMMTISENADNYTSLKTRDGIDEVRRTLSSNGNYGLSCQSCDEGTTVLHMNFTKHVVDQLGIFHPDSFKMYAPRILCYLLARCLYSVTVGESRMVKYDQNKFENLLVGYGTLYINYTETFKYCGIRVDFPTLKSGLSKKKKNGFNGKYNHINKMIMQYLTPETPLPPIIALDEMEIDIEKVEEMAKSYDFYILPASPLTDLNEKNPYLKLVKDGSYYELNEANDMKQSKSEWDEAKTDCTCYHMAILR